MENKATLDSLVEKYNNVHCVSQKEILNELKADFEKNFVGTASQLREQEASLMEKAKTIFKERRNQYHEAQGKIEDEIKDYMFNQGHIKDRDIFEKMYSLAYREGHSGGFHEIYNYLADYDDLVNDCLKIYKEKNPS